VNRKDPSGYYALLGIIETATANEIKAAFRQKAKELHPDRNPSPDSVKQFQHLNEAYKVLSNPDTRARYDTFYAQIPKAETESYQKVAPEPIVCSCCEKVTAQPRYIIFFQVTSFIFLTIRTPIQGVFCPKCAESKAIQSTITTWVFGWWGLPWGLIYSVSTIFHNLFGGSKPNEVNARLLLYQSWVFTTQNKFELARAVAADAQDFAREIKREDERKILNVAEELLSILDTKEPIKRLKNVWSIPNRAFYVQGSILVGHLL
jgi:DnaJ-domain-containing protein 1